MRENRTCGSEGGETGQPVFPTPIFGPKVRERGHRPEIGKLFRLSQLRVLGSPSCDRRLLSVGPLCHPWALTRPVSRTAIS
jgi:hypothetical protein